MSPSAHSKNLVEAGFSTPVAAVEARTARRDRPATTGGPGTSQRLMAGYNHNIPFGGVVYHVQTEFYGSDPAHVDTHAFDDGRVVGSQRSGVELSGDDVDVRVLSQMKAQQKEMIRQLISGKLSPRQPEAPLGASAARSPAGEALRGGADSGHLEVSLELRRSLIGFVRAVQGDRRPESDELVDRLRSVINTIAVMLGKHGYDHSRKEEMAEFLIARSEGLDWLRRGSDAESDRGLRIWQGFARIARSLSGLNRRRELVEHDAEVWHRVLRSMDRLTDGQAVDDDLMESLNSTWGRDRDLDILLECPAGLDVGGLRRTIEAACDRLPAVTPDEAEPGDAEIAPGGDAR